MRSGRVLRHAAVERRPMYAKVLGVRHLDLSGLVCFILFEGALGLATLLALAELASWWTVIVLPAAVAAMVKFNDMVAGSLRPVVRVPGRAVVAVVPPVVARRPAVGRARVVPAQVYRAAVPAEVVRATAAVAVARGPVQPVRGGARHRVGRQRGERPREEFQGHAARHSASRRYR